MEPSSHFGDPINPMPGTGFDVSMTTGFPLSFDEANRQAEQEKKRQDRQAEEWRFVQELKDDGGVILQRIAAQAFRRIRQLGSGEDHELTFLLQLMETTVTTEVPMRDLFAKYALRDFFAQLAGLPLESEGHQPGLFDQE